MSFSDSIEVRGENFNIKTKTNNENNFSFVIIKIFNENKLIWKDRVLYPENSEISIFEYSYITHNNIVKYFKNMLSAVDKNINFELLNNTISDFKKRIGRGLSLVEILVKDNLFSIANYNANKHATKLFIDLYNKFSNKLKFKKIGDSQLKYYFLMLSGNRAVIVGKIGESDLIYGLIINLNETPMGVMINILLPKFIKEIKKILL